MSQLARLIEIDRLVRGGKAPTPESLARQLGVTKRQIFLDRNRLISDLGAPLQFDRKRRGWVYTDATWVFSTAILTEGELLAFFLSVEIARSAGNDGLDDALASAVAKIARGLGEVVSVDLSALRDSLTIASPPAARVNARTAMQLTRAQAMRRKVSMLYASASSGETKWRVVHPYHFYLARSEWLLLAFDEDRGETRTFNAHRVQGLKILQAPFVRDPGFDPNGMTRTMLWAEAGKRVFEVAVAFDVYQARFIRERSWHPDQRIEEQSDGGLVLHFPASGLGEVARWVLGYGKHAQVLGYGKHAQVLAPPELAALVGEHIQQLARIYGTS